MIRSHLMRHYFTILVIIAGFPLEASGKLFHFTVATQRTDGLSQFARSAELKDIKVKILGLDSGLGNIDMLSTGGAFKLKLLQKELLLLSEELEVNRSRSSGIHVNKVTDFDSCFADGPEEGTERHCGHSDRSEDSGSQEVKQAYDEVNVIFTDSYDVLYLNTSESIESAFRRFKTDLLFGAESFCWPQENLKNQYPTVRSPYKYLNSGGFIGKLKTVLKVLENVTSLNENDDDQLFFTEIYLKDLKRKQFNIRLDHEARIFQNLNGAEDHVLVLPHPDSKLERTEMAEFFPKMLLVNNVTVSMPLIVHGNGPSKEYLNFYLSNYFAQAEPPPRTWELPENILDDKSLPNLYMALILEEPTPFLKDFFECVSKLEYPEDKLTIALYITESGEAQMKEIQCNLHLLSPMASKVTVWTSKKSCDQLNRCEPRSVKMGLFKDLADEFKEKERKKSGDESHLFLLDSGVRLLNTKVLLSLVKSNLGILCPILSHDVIMWSTYWGAVSWDGYYKRAPDYFDVVGGNLKGVVNAAYVYGAIMIKPHLLPLVVDVLSTCDSDHIEEMDIAAAYCLRERGVFMYAVNVEDYGNVVLRDNFDPDIKHPELYMLHNAPLQWQNKYINIEEYTKLLGYRDLREFEQPCPEVFRLSVFSERFTRELIEVAEHMNKWSGGGHKPNVDDRYGEDFVESYPTVDVHLYQLGFNDTWLKVIEYLLLPVLEVLYEDFNFYFADYENGRPGFLFVARYRPEEQSFLRLHHDHSSYTLNVALNNPGEDFEGGGCRFKRQNCSVTDSRAGQVLVHPGKLTHLHEGLRTTAGTRYILVSFMIPN